MVKMPPGFKLSMVKSMAKKPTSLRFPMVMKIVKVTPAFLVFMVKVKNGKMSPVFVVLKVKKMVKVPISHAHHPRKQSSSIA